MKRYTILFLTFIYLSFNIIKVIPAATIDTFSEGVYTETDLKMLPNNIYSIENISASNRIFLLVFDEKQRIIQSMLLEPKSPKYNLLPIKTNYRIALIGKGNVILYKVDPYPTL